MPRGIISLERMFDPDMIRDERVTSFIDVELADEINIRTPTGIKNILIGKSCVGQERKKIIAIIKQYIDVIAWKYEHLKTYNLDIITHTIPLKPGVAPFRQRQRQVNALLEPISFQEVQKLAESGIVYPIRHSSWVANIVPIHKKSEEIRICIDFRHLNHASKKDNYMLPSLDEVLQIINRSKMMAFLDGYSGYNQILVAKKDQLKTAFTTKWGTFAYSRMPFGLINAGTTFQ